MAKSTQPTKAILWDLDGTILDSVSVMQAILKEIFPKMGLETVSREDIRTHFHGPLADVLLKISGPDTDQDELFSYFLEAQVKHYDSPVSHTGIHDAIQLFADLGIKQAIVTSRADHNGDRAGAKSVVKTMQLDLHIKTVISAEDTPFHKPHPAPIFAALEALGVKPENAVMIGDQFVDAEAARAAGTHSILIDHEKTEESQRSMIEANPDVLCQDAEELINAVKQLLNV